MKAVEKKALVQALRNCSYNVSQAATYLGIPRQTIQYKLKIHGLSEIDAAREGKWVEKTQP